jgi:hypothetical protein
MRKVTKLIERLRIQRMNVDPEFKHVSAMSNCKSQSSGCMHLLFWDQSWNLKFWWTRLLNTKGFTCSVCLETSPSRHSGCGVSRNKTYTLPVWCRPDLMPLGRIWLLSLNQDIENRGSLQKRLSSMSISRRVSWLRAQTEEASKIEWEDLAHRILAWLKHKQWGMRMIKWSCICEG